MLTGFWGQGTKSLNHEDDEFVYLHKQTYCKHDVPAVLCQDATHVIVTQEMFAMA